MTGKPVEWSASARKELRTFPAVVQREFGFALYLVQIGQTPLNAKPLHGQLRGTFEISESDATGTYRLVYTVQTGEIVYVLHAFQKKSPHGTGASATPARTTNGSCVINGAIFERGSGNVFSDLGLPNAEELLVKAQLMQAINAEIKRRGVSQADAGELVGLAQSDLSRIANGRCSGFSMPSLIDVLRHLGRDVEIRVTPGSGTIGELRFREVSKR